MRSKITVLLIVATLGIHCASTDPMRPWKGATLDQFIAAAGAPTGDKHLADGARVVEYLEEGRRLPGDVRKEEWVNCTLRINADPSGRIESWQWITRDYVCTKVPPPVRASSPMK